MHRGTTILAALALGARPCAGQSLSEKLGQLFYYTSCDLPLCLTYKQATYGLDYTTRASLASSTTLDFFNAAIGATLGSLPVSATSSGLTFRFVNGAPVATTSSAGPIFAERAQTLGRGRLLLNVNASRIALDRVRGVRMQDAVIYFDSQRINAAPSGDYDVLEANPRIRLSLQTVAAVATYGLSDRVDIGVVVPVVAVSLDATSTARITSPIGPISGNHMFGTDAAPTNTASSAVSGDFSGIGDVVVRAKANLRDTGRVGAALLGEVRLPTGDADNFTGTGHVALRAVGVVSGLRGDFSPHLNAGLAVRPGAEQSGSAVLTAGFDHRAAPWATVAVDLLSEVQLTGKRLRIPPPAFFANGTPLPSSNVPDRQRDDPLGLSAGAKFLFYGTTVVANALLPLNDAGLRASRIGTIGVERAFR